MSHGLDGAPDVDLLEVDWFALADRPVAGLRAMFNVVPKAAGANSAGSCGPWAPGGISEYQFATGRVTAEIAGREYDSSGATP